MIELHSVNICVNPEVGLLERVCVSEACALTWTGKAMVDVSGCSFELWFCRSSSRTKASCALQRADAQTVSVCW